MIDFASHCLISVLVECYQVISEMTNGGVDRSIECVGNIDAMISAFECVRDVIPRILDILGFQKLSR